MSRDRTEIPYVQSVGSQDVPPPYHFPTVGVHSFVWKADMLRVQQYCDRYLNLRDRDERGFEYRPVPAWPYAMLLFLDYPEMISTFGKPFGEIPYSERGITSQREAFVAIPVVRYGTNPANFLAHAAVEWIVPVIGVSEPWSSVCGREMLGLGKMLSEIRIANSPGNGAFTGSVDLPGWLERGPGEVQAVHPFLKVTTGPVLPVAEKLTGAGSLADLLHSPEAGGLMETMGKLSNFVDLFSLGTIPTVMRTVGLKQYRDAAFPTKAIYQALVTCRSFYSNLTDVEFFDESDVDITYYDTGSFHDVLTTLFDLGPEPSGQSITAKPEAAFRFTSDIDFDWMRVIHEFAIDGDDGIQPRAARSDLQAPWIKPWQGVLRGLSQRIDRPMTDFVDSFSSNHLLPSWHTKGARHWCFVIDVGHRNMQSYLDTHLNAPGPDRSPYYYTVASEHCSGILTAVDHPRFSSERDGIAGWDMVSHREVFWSFPALRYQVDNQNLLSNPRRVWIQPFAFDSNASVMFASREIWGSEKQLGAIDYEGADAARLKILLSTQGFRHFSPHSRSEAIGVLRITSDPGIEPVAYSEIYDPENLAGFGGILAEYAPPKGTAHHISPKILGVPHAIEINTLKQFRDVFDMRVAAYRAIIRTHAVHFNVREPRFYKGEDITAEFIWSASMAQKFERLFGKSEQDTQEATLRSSAIDEDPHEADWKMPVLQMAVKFASSFVSDSRFTVVDTLHTYGAQVNS